MLRYIIKRILMLFLVILGALTIVFILSEVTPGDPVVQMLGSEVSDEVLEAKRVELGLDKPVYVQYARYIWNFFTKFDLGTSYETHQPVGSEIMSRWPYTLKLGGMSMLLTLLIALPLGVISAVKQYTWIDNGLMAFALICASVPSFWLGLMTIRYFAVQLGWLPSSGVRELAGWILPVSVLALTSCAQLMRITRSSMLEVIRMDFMNTARAKGQTEGRVIMRHAFRNALIPIVTAIGNMMGILLGGTVMIESVFALPGIGKYMTDAISTRNWPAIQGGVVFLAIGFSIINLIIDLIYVLIDPRLVTMYSGVRGREIKKLKREIAQNKAVI